MADLFVKAARLIAMGDRATEGGERLRLAGRPHGQVKACNDTLAGAAARLAENGQSLIAAPRQTAVVAGLLLELLHPAWRQDGAHHFENQLALLVGIERTADKLRSDQPGVGNVRSQCDSVGIGYRERLASVTNVDAIVPIEADRAALLIAECAVKSEDGFFTGIGTAEPRIQPQALPTPKYPSNRRQPPRRRS